ncbi:hypothetical protein V5O48_015698, partial [Marasmius crinis-equi]
EANLTTSTSDRISTARGALEKAISMLSVTGQFEGSPFWPPGALFSQMADFDITTNQTIYKDSVLKYLPLAAVNGTGFEPEDKQYELRFVTLLSGQLDCMLIRCLFFKVASSLLYGYAALSEESWNYGRAFTLYQEDLVAGNMPAKNFTLITECSNAAMAGGTFATNDQSDPAIQAVSTGAFFVLSALLAETTSNSTYLEAALQAQKFLVAHLYKPHIVLDRISAKKENSCSNPGTSTNSFNSGLMIEGTVILASMNKSTVGEDLADFYFPRALAALHSRDASPPDVKSYAEKYLIVQYNAIINNAAGQNNTYGGRWVGPPAAGFSGDNQVIALGVLVPAISLRTIESTTPSQAHSHAGAIAGGVVGGLCSLLLIVGVTLWFLRRKRTTAHSEDVDPTPYPILEPSSSHPQTRNLPTPFGGPNLPSKHDRNDRVVATPHVSSTSPSIQPSTDESGTTQLEINRLHTNVEQIMTLLNLNDRERRSGGGMADNEEQPPDYQSNYDGGRIKR